MKDMTEELYGKLALTNILTSIWMGDWEKFEGIMKEMPEELRVQLPFYEFYNREQAELWYDNHFYIPGNHFISPYFSSYALSNQADDEERKKDLLCLIGIYEKTGFYYPLEKEIYPDHIGCLTAFLGSIIQETIKAENEQDEEYKGKLAELESYILDHYILPILQQLQKQAQPRLKDPFFKQFLAYYVKTMEEEWGRRYLT